MGLGVVGSGVAKALLEKAGQLTKQAGGTLVLEKVLVADIDKHRPVQMAPGLLTQDPRRILDSPNIGIVVELIGGEDPAAAYIESALKNGKHVVTANKDVMAKFGPELLQLADQNGVEILYEASVGGGIPLLLPLKQSLAANDISSIRAIINGTTNYILTKMSQDGLSFHIALREAQEEGYAEADPAKDVEGLDAAYKLAILATSAFQSTVRPSDIYCQGITRLGEADFLHARELGYEIKLLAIAKKTEGAIEARVHPVLIPADYLLAKVTGVFNAIQIEGDLVGQVLFYGKGAGSLPTASAVVADIIAVARSIRGPRPEPMPAGTVVQDMVPVKPIFDLVSPYYLRMNIADQPGVLAQIAHVLGDRSISIASVIQKRADPVTHSAEIVIMTHPAREQFMDDALAEMAKLSVVREICNFIRVEG